MNAITFQSFDHALNILYIAKAASRMIKQENITKARGVIEHLPLHEQAAMRGILSAISIGALPSTTLCDEAINSLESVAKGMYD